MLPDWARADATFEGAHLVDAILGKTNDKRITRMKTVYASTEDPFITQAWKVFLSDAVTALEGLKINKSPNDDPTSQEQLRTVQCGTGTSRIYDSFPYISLSAKERKEQKKKGMQPPFLPPLDKDRYIEKDIFGARQYLHHTYEAFLWSFMASLGPKTMMQGSFDLLECYSHSKAMSPSAGHGKLMEPRMWFWGVFADAKHCLVDWRTWLDDLQEKPPEDYLLLCGTTAAPGKTSRTIDQNRKDAIAALHRGQLVELLGEDDVLFLERAYEVLQGYSHCVPFDGNNLSGGGKNKLTFCAEAKSFIASSNKTSRLGRRARAGISPEMLEDLTLWLICFDAVRLPELFDIAIEQEKAGANHASVAIALLTHAWESCGGELCLLCHLLWSMLTWRYPSLRRLEVFQWFFKTKRYGEVQPLDEAMIKQYIADYGKKYDELAAEDNGTESKPDDKKNIKSTSSRKGKDKAEEGFCIETATDGAAGEGGENIVKDVMMSPACVEGDEGDGVGGTGGVALVEGVEETLAVDIEALKRQSRLRKKIVT
ncbi:hypothetical protein CALCODRAFT_531670 [Calocera cornea HHB12733]|uniref:Uncharacterized protein n=1 Tax=Calocera cornea HHB12733 TaxID=1353952 RepID=A0A165D7N3_9BASI|nr:hypothetical protein CALCODRAFT_531670 [Calocera cornea HHB12733]